MSIEFERYPECIMLLPIIAVDWGAGIEIQIGWLQWGLVVNFG